MQSNLLAKPCPGAECAPEISPDTTSLAASSPAPVTRRGFFRNLASDALATAEWAALTAPVIMRITVWNGAGQNKESESSTTVPTSAYTGTDRIERFPSGGEFQNLGVSHTADSYRKHREHIESRVSAADIILLEGGERDDRQPNVFFSSVRDFALALGKKVIAIDTNTREWAAIQSEGSNIAAVVGGGMLVNQHISFRQEGEYSLSFSRRALIRAGAWLGALTGFPSPPLLANWIGGSKEYPQSDTSYIADGRTVMMLENIRRIAEDNPQSKVLSITGNGHAMGFGDYLSLPERYRDFEHRRAAYRVTYGLVYDSEPREIR